MDKGKIYEILLENPTYQAHLISLSLLTNESIVDIINDVISGVYTSGNEDTVCEIIDIAFCQKITENLN